MFAFPDVMHLLAHEFAGLGGRRLALGPVTAGPFERLFFRHRLFSSGSMVQVWTVAWRGLPGDSVSISKSFSFQAAKPPSISITG